MARMTAKEQFGKWVAVEIQDGKAMTADEELKELDEMLNAANAAIRYCYEKMEEAYGPNAAEQMVRDNEHIKAVEFARA